MLGFYRYRSPTNFRGGREKVDGKIAQFWGFGANSRRFRPKPLEGFVPPRKDCVFEVRRKNRPDEWGAPVLLGNGIKRNAYLFILNRPSFWPYPRNSSI